MKPLEKKNLGIRHCITGLKQEYYRKLVISDRLKYLIKKDSTVNYKEIKNSKNKNKRFCLTVDGIIVDYNNFTKEEALELVKNNNELRTIILLVLFVNKALTEKTLSMIHFK